MAGLSGRMEKVNALSSAHSAQELFCPGSTVLADKRADIWKIQRHGDCGSDHFRQIGGWRHKAAVHKTASGCARVRGLLRAHVYLFAQCKTSVKISTGVLHQWLNHIDGRNTWRSSRPAVLRYQVAIHATYFLAINDPWLKVWFDQLCKSYTSCMTHNVGRTSVSVLACAVNHMAGRSSDCSWCGTLKEFLNQKIE